MRSQSGLTLIELLLVLAIIGIISAIAIPALLGQRARARDKASIANMEGLLGGLAGQYDLLREEGLNHAGIVASLSTYLARAGAAERNPWDPASAAYSSSVAEVGSGAWATQSAALTGLRAKALASDKGQANFEISFPSGATPGFLGGCVQIDGRINDSCTVAKVATVE